MSLIPEPGAPGTAPSAPGSSSPQDGRTRHHHAGWELRCAGDEITAITRAGTVLLDSLRPALRDADWNTIPAQALESTWSEDHGTRHRLQTLRYHDGTSAISAVTELEISAEMLRYRFALTPSADLSTNRVGLTAMLPRTAAGLDGVLSTPSGHVRPFRFPRLISPFQPAFDIRSLEFGIHGVRARLELLGDVFEMEDQRNWTDASFKIYSRPLALPFPYPVRAGETVEQEVRLTVLGEDESVRVADRAAGAAPGTAADALLGTSPEVVVPALGTGATTQYSAAVSAPVPQLPGLSHLLVETSDGFPQDRVLGSATAEAAALGVPVDLRIAATEQTDPAAVLAVADRVGLPVARLAAVDAGRHVTTGPLWERLQEAAAGRAIELIAGARSHFTELNREIHEIPDDAAALTFPSTPQMHMQEPWHVVESISALGDVLETAAALRPDHPLHLGPVTLRPRVNAVATRPELVDRSDGTGYGAHLVPGADDPHQQSSWAGAWAAAVILRAAAAGSRSVTLAELAGPRGLLRPGGELTPMGELVALLAPLSGCSARVVCDIAGSGTALARFDERLLVVNARLEDWTLDLGGLAPPSGSTQVHVPAGSWRVLTVPTVRSAA